MPPLRVFSLAPGEGKTALVTALRELFEDAEVEESDGGPGLLVAAYRGANTAADVIAAKPTAVVLNAVPALHSRFVSEHVIAELEAAGIAVLGVLPELRILRATTVEELAAFLEGEVLTAPERVNNVIEHYLVGAMSHLGGSGLAYFNRFENKAVVTGGDRIDVHMSALGTPCACIVATGGFDPDPVVVERAEAEGVPIVKVAPDTLPTMDEISRFLRQVRFTQPFKRQPMLDLVRTHLDLTKTERLLGAGVAS